MLKDFAARMQGVPQRIEGIRACDAVQHIVGEGVRERIEGLMKILKSEVAS